LLRSLIEVLDHRPRSVYHGHCSNDVKVVQRRHFTSQPRSATRCRFSITEKSVNCDHPVDNTME
jgi:hypothetical protein